jgi:hypothetical protein
MPSGNGDTLAVKKEALLESVERNEEELRQAVDELTTVAQHRFDLRTRIADHPWPWLVGGFVVGLWLARR